MRKSLLPLLGIVIVGCQHKDVGNKQNTSTFNEVVYSVSLDDNKGVKRLYVINDSLYQKAYASLSEPMLATLLHEEQVLTDSLLKAKLDFLKLYMSGLGEDHTTMALNDIETELLRSSNDNLKDILCLWNDVNYTPSRLYNPILQSQFNKAYNNLKSNLSLYARLSTILNQTEIELDKERKAWYELMRLRANISSLLHSSQKQIFDNATYRLQWYQLIQLKNEYWGYGMLEREVDDCILHDTCSYQEAIDYKGFTLVSEEYYKSRFGCSYIEYLRK